MKSLFGSQLLRSLSAANDRTLARTLRASLGELRAALVFHRVRETRSKLSMPSAEIDKLIEFMLEIRGELTVCFDDGYRDAAGYVLSRAARFPRVEWLFFVCPRRTELRIPFSWDAGDGTALAEVEQIREIQRLPNAALGNHTNLHERSTLLPAGDWCTEFQRSKRDFERLFGPQLHFAFPFGVPRVDFTGEHVEELRTLGDFFIWSTEPRPYHPGERRPGALLPRFCIDGTRTWKESAVHIALHALRARIAGQARA
jgi:hypothetical protein